MESRYAPQAVEARWRAVWEKYQTYRSQPDARPPYTIVMPPPNVTGVLHMGHVLNNTLQDILARFYRMRGYNVCWVPGTDHASIATEAKVVARLRSQGLQKHEIGREAFLREAWKWTEEHSGIIVQQLKTLGVSADWQRYRFTLEPSLYRAVIETFVRLYRDGLIYRGKRMIHWDPVALTALSDEEVLYKEHESELCYVRYVADKGDYLVIATVRPETILADVAVAVRPADERYKSWIGRQVRVPLTDRYVPVIADEAVDADFGTGCLKVTPAHDPKDYEIGQRHKLPIIDVFTADARLNENAGPYKGLSREEARRRIIHDLHEAGLIEKIEPYKHSVGHSERTDAVVEPRLSEQWFVRMKPLAELAQQAVEAGDILLVPERFSAIYHHWLENIKDWCISRQLWWGHRIPAWYAPDGQIFVAVSESEAYAQAQAAGYDPRTLRQDDDVLDTWFSSWLWPLSVFDFFEDPRNPDFQYYYPTQVLVTAPEILFFWVARMIMAGYYFTGKKPFSTVYLHGIVRDKQRRKMSKSLGNSPDPLNLIQAYGADAVRMGIIMSAPAGNDLLFDEALCEQGKNFCNKLWNSFRLLHLWRQRTQDQPSDSPLAWEAYRWFEAYLSLVEAEVEKMIREYRFYECSHKLYSFVWDQFCSWYLEALKPTPPAPLLEKVEDQAVRILRLLHPFMPYITEELWHQLTEAPEELSLSHSSYSPVDQSEVDWFLLDAVRLAQTSISKIRQIKQALHLSDLKAMRIAGYQAKMAPILKLWLEHFLEVPLLHPSDRGETDHLLRLPIRATGVESDFRTRSTLYQEIFYLDAGIEEHKRMEMVNMLKKELREAESFRESILRKLENQQFIQKAPQEIVEKEQKKLSDIEVRLSWIREQLEAMGATL